MDSSSTSTGVIGTDSVIISYPERKVILGQGSFGVVFATRLGRARLAVKIVHCGKHWRRHHEKLETEVMPLTMRARNCWKHVTSANRAFAHENRASDLAQLSKMATSTGAFSPRRKERSARSCPCSKCHSRRQHIRNHSNGNNSPCHVAHHPRLCKHRPNSKFNNRLCKHPQ